MSRSRLHFIWASVAFGLVVLIAPLARAAESVLELIPERALGFAVLNRLGEVDAKLQKLAQTMELPGPSPLLIFRGTVGIQKGLDEQGSAAIVALPGETPEAAPAVLVLLPVTNYQEFIEQFSPEKVSDTISKVQVMGRSCLVGKKASYAVFLASEDQATLAAVLSSDKALTEPAKSWQPWLAEKDVAVVLPEPGVKLAMTRILQTLDTLSRSIPSTSPQGKMAANAFEMYGNMVTLARDEVTVAGMGVFVASDGDLRLASRARLVSGGTFDRTLSSTKPLGKYPLAGLPAGPYVLAFSGAIPEVPTAQMETFARAMMQGSADLYGLSEEQVKKLSEASLKTMRQMRDIAMALGVAKAGDPLYSNMVVVTRVEDSKAFLAEYAKQMKDMAQITRDAKKSPFRGLEVEEVPVGDVSALKITMDMAQAFAAQGVPGQTQAMAEAMYGPGGKMTSYMAAADETTVVFAYFSKDVLLRGMEAVKAPAKSLDSDKGVSEMAAKLPAGSAWVGYVSPRGSIEYVKQSMKAFAPQVSGFALAEFPETPPVGFAAGVSPGEVQKLLVIPAAVLKAVGQYVKTIRPQAQPAAQ